MLSNGVKVKNLRWLGMFRLKKFFWYLLIEKFVLLCYGMFEYVGLFFVISVMVSNLFFFILIEVMLYIFVLFEFLIFD